jgi:hypothetical protein
MKTDLIINRIYNSKGDPAILSRIFVENDEKIPQKIKLTILKLAGIHFFDPSLPVSEIKNLTGFSINNIKNRITG